MTDQTPIYDAVLEVEPPAFLPVSIRRVLYLVSLVGLFVGPLLSVSLPEYGAAIITSSNALGAVALGVAIGNART